MFNMLAPVNRSLGVVCLLLALTLPHSLFAEFGSADAARLHELYRQRRYEECYRTARREAAEHTESAVPLFYASIALVKAEEDPANRKRMRQPMAQALNLLEQAKGRDPRGQQLQRYRTGLAYLQRRIFQRLKAAYLSGETGARALFDQLHQLFPHREGTWKNLFHAATNAPVEGYEFGAWDHPFYRLADTGAELSYVPADARTILHLHNLARMNPQLFEQTYWKEYASRTRQNMHNSYVQSLGKDLRDGRPAPLLIPDPKLMKASQYHANDLLRSRTFSHSSSNGTSFGERLRSFVPQAGHIGENCAAGNDEAIDTFFQLMIDEGIQGVGHRVNIMRTGYVYVGIGVAQSGRSWKIWVFDFAGNV